MGGRAAAAAFYPLKLLRAIVLGMARTRDRVNGIREMTYAETEFRDALMAVRDLLPDIENDEPNKNSDTKAKISSIPLHGGGTLPISYEDHNLKAV